MRKPLSLMLASLPLLVMGGVTGQYFFKMLAVLAFVSGALWFLWYGIDRATKDEEPPQ